MYLSLQRLQILMICHTLLLFIFIFAVCQICFKSLQRANLLLHAYRQQILQSLLSTSGYDASVPPDFEMGKSPL